MPHRRHPGNLLEVNNQRFLIDSGPGTVHSLSFFNLKLDQLQGAFYTHFHLDHIGDLANIITWFQVIPWTAEKEGVTYIAPTFTIYGPVGIKRYIQDILPLTPDRSLPNNIFITEVNSGDKLKFEHFTAEVSKVPHTQESVGYRFTLNNGKVVAITGDTGFGPEVTRLIKNADIAVLECTYSDELYEKMKAFVHHLGPTSAAQLAVAGTIKTLILTHLYPSADAVDSAAIASKTFTTGTVLTAQDGMTISLD